ATADTRKAPAANLRLLPISTTKPANEQTTQTTTTNERRERYASAARDARPALHPAQQSRGRPPQRAPGRRSGHCRARRRHCCATTALQRDNGVARQRRCATTALLRESGIASELRAHPMTIAKIKQMR